MPTLYIVATPIGNLEDISLRAIRILRQVSLIAAEDTRTTKNLLNKYKIKTRLTSYYEFNKRTKLKYLMNILKNNDIALVSDAGVPGISDTGYEIITEAIKNNIRVVAIPGASAIITALIISGLPIDKFTYLGFLPRRKNERRRYLQSIANEEKTIVIFESPHRLIESLKDIIEILGDRRIAICKELTKIHEEVFRGTVSQALDYFEKPMGEFTLVIEGKHFQFNEPISEDIIREMRDFYNQGLKATIAISLISSKYNIPRNQLYKIWLNSKKEFKNA